MAGFYYLFFTALLPLMGCLHGTNIEHEQESKSLSRKLLSSNQFTPAQGISFDFVPNPSPPELPFDFPPTASPPSPSFPPSGSPFELPAVPVPSPSTDQRKGLWCVAKPSAPHSKLQEAMDYACGQGGADCEEIRPRGSCYFPDDLVAHASFAFNSYWQKNKRIGGTCSFDGTAMIVDSDPSTLQCRYMHI